MSAEQGRRFPYGEARRDGARVAGWRQCAATVRAALETAGWDGQWYRRGYYDDGTVLGSDESAECTIAAIAQSWSVMSGVADPAHAAQAMAAVDERLIRRDDKIALLFTPPFDSTSQDPGYVKGYPPGIRENGGQYTHGAIWSIFAFAMLGQGDKAGELFDILNPIHHSDTPDALARYQVEAYVALPFAPEIVLPTIAHCDRLHPADVHPYGFKATFNQTFLDGSGGPHGWVSPWHFGLNQGPVVVMIENHQSGLVWRLTRGCPPIVTGLRAAGFTGGWLSNDDQRA